MTKQNGPEHAHQPHALPHGQMHFPQIAPETALLSNRRRVRLQADYGNRIEEKRTSTARRRMGTTTCSHKSSGHEPQLRNSLKIYWSLYNRCYWPMRQ
ncbi:hypothetical protein FHX05_005710 [Rhizobium sp. BK491]|nr:hypothetical protein [Rhizobium sp. BK491]